MWLKSERPSDPITASFLSRALDKEKTSFSIFLLSSKLTIFLFLFSKHDTNDIADPSSMQDACHIRTSWWPYLLYSLFDLVVEHWKVESEGLRVLSHTHDKMKKTSFSTELKIYQLSYHIYCFVVVVYLE